MSIGVSAAQRLGFEAMNGPTVWFVPLAVVTMITIANLAMAWAGLVEYGYFSPYVAASAGVSARLCIRSGMLTALLSIFTWNFLIVPPVLALSVPSVAEAVAWMAAIAAVALCAPRIKPGAPAKPVDRKAPLPFVRSKTQNGKGPSQDASCWAPLRTGNWQSDDHYGRQIGRLWIDKRQSGEPGAPPLSFIVHDMIGEGEWSGVEAGFAHAIERAAAAGEELPMLTPEPFIPTILLAEHDAQNLRPE